MIFQGMDVTGFTLELDGAPDEIERIIKAVGDEFSRIASDNFSLSDQPLRLVGLIHERPHHMVGTLTVRNKTSTMVA